MVSSISVMTKDSGTCSEFRINPRFTLFQNKFQKPAVKKNVLSEEYQKITEHTLQNQLAEQCANHGIEINKEELHELILFHEYLSRHVNYSAVRVVQCMFLWAEWVRFFKKHTRDFPRIILEKEFGDLIIQHFNPRVGEDGFLGSVYTGITFCK
jgi:hypothetical protein